MRRIMAAVAGVLLSLTLLVGLVGCTGDDPTEEPSGSSGGDSSATAEPRVPTKVTLGKVAGKLSKKQRRTTRRSVTRVVDRWLDAAYVRGDYPRQSFADAFPGFTKGAAGLARKQRRVMSNATVAARVEGVEVKKRTLAIDVLAPRGKPAGATARVVLTMKFSGQVRRTDRVRGRLLLTPVRKGWKVFGFDVRRKAVRSGKK